MRPSFILALLLLIPLAIPLAACSSTGDELVIGGPVTLGGGMTGGSEEIVPDVTRKRIRLEWRNLKPGRKDRPLGLINVTSPEIKEIYQPANIHVKPVADVTMGALLEQLRDFGFFDHAKRGRSLDSFRPYDGQIGVIHLSRDGETWYLLFTRGMGESDVPRVYLDCRLAFFAVHSRTIWHRPSTSTSTNVDPSRVFRVDPPTRTRPRR